ncbi:MULTISPECIES: N-formylglutamate amidohydrolase [Thioclava]|uniref:N-formylglutamate amidohydrolase n=1 Tax=Thioclava electrotropha TaxID=1549850 RepID=A0ABX6YQV8_9RHOB|nr:MULTISPECIES: N-formylglutamate amidohydrolase [Thioclava]QPZ89655.1 N-formylglutamate amidohydrolase [Thioclava electrotropha]
MSDSPALLPPFRLVRPKALRTAAVFASPHSGAQYPHSLQERAVLDMLRLRSSEDAFVDELLADVPRFGAPLLCAQYPRAWVDLNRAEDELDSALIAGLDRAHPGPRVAAGLGVIPRVVSGARAIYRGKIPMIEAEARINHVWRPYHAQLEALMAEAHGAFGQAILLDMHSMPSEALATTGPRRAEIVLGDRYGTSADREIVREIELIFEGEGLNVARNSPFAGAYITQRYGHPREGYHAIQIEIDRALYMDQHRIAPNENFNAFAALMSRVARQIADLGAHPLRHAAE